MPAASPDLPSDPLAETIRLIGTAHFPDALFGLLHARYRIDQLIVFTRGRGSSLLPLMAINRRAPRLASRLAELYLNRYSGRDPNGALLTANRSPAREILIRPLPRSAQADREYWHCLFVEPELADKLSVIALSPGPATYLNLYRGRAAGPFTEADAEGLERLAPILVSLIERHSELSDDTADFGLPALLAWVEGAARTRAAALSPRETETCARILMGCTAEATALELGVSPSTAETYRKRAYAKLGISTRNELFALIMRQARR